MSGSHQIHDKQIISIMKKKLNKIHEGKVLNHLYCFL